MSVGTWQKFVKIENSLVLQKHSYCITNSIRTSSSFLPFLHFEMGLLALFLQGHSYKFLYLYQYLLWLRLLAIVGTRNEWWNTVLTFLFCSISSIISYKKKKTAAKNKGWVHLPVYIYCICLRFLMMMMILKAIERIRQEMGPASTVGVSTKPFYLRSCTQCFLIMEKVN